MSQGIECTVHGSLSRHPHRAHSRNPCHIPLCGISSGAENFCQLDTSKTRANLTVTKTVGFEVQEHSLPADIASWSLQKWRSCQPFVNNNEKCLSVTRLQVAKAYWAYAFCLMPAPRNRVSSCSFRPPQRRHTSCPCQWSSRNTRSQTL